MRSVNLVAAAAAVCGAMFGGAGGPARAQVVDPFVGTWRIATILTIPDYAPLNLQQARGLVGRTIQVANGRVQSWSNIASRPQPDVCTAPEFQTVQATRARMVADTRLRQEDLAALPASFVELTITCRGNFVMALRQVSPTVLVAELESVLFRIERAAASAATPGGPTQSGTPGAGTPGAGTPGPSFSCAQARSVEERLICGDSGLAATDRAIAESYNKLLQALPEAQRDALRREQRDWVANRAKQCHIAADTRLTDDNRSTLVQCLANVFSARQRDLDARLRRAQG
jgi:uncharacterized protein YecT (DUF1311 family)